MAIGTYDPKQVICSFGGVELTGLAEDTAIKIAQLSNGITSKTGCSGDVVRVISPDSRHEITVTLLQTSTSNDYLTAINSRDVTDGTGVLPFLMKDLSGNTTFYNANAWITKKPDVTRGNTDNDNVWVFHSAGGTLFVGGND